MQRGGYIDHEPMASIGSYFIGDLSFSYRLRIFYEPGTKFSSLVNNLAFSKLRTRAI